MGTAQTVQSSPEKESPRQPPKKPTTGFLWLREHVGHGDSTGHMALDDQLYRVSESQDCGGRIRGLGRTGMGFELAVDQVDDPVGGDSLPGRRSSASLPDP